jgi:hypothetical protein
VFLLRECKKHQHLLPWPRVVADRLLVHVRQQRLEPRLVLPRSDRLQPHEHANPVDDGRLTERRQPFYRPPHRHFDGLGLLLLPGIGLGQGLLNACQQLRPLQLRVHVVSLALLEDALRL